MRRGDQTAVVTTKFQFFHEKKYCCILYFFYFRSSWMRLIWHGKSHENARSSVAQLVYDVKFAHPEKLFQHTYRPVYLSVPQIQYLSESNLGLTYVINDINRFHDRNCPKNRVLWGKNKKKSMKMCRKLVTKGFLLPQLEE